EGWLHGAALDRGRHVGGGQRLPPAESLQTPASPPGRPRRSESRPQEFHPQPLAERCVSLSAHTAPIKQTRPVSLVSSVRRAAGISGRPSARRFAPVSCVYGTACTSSSPRQPAKC